MAAPDYQQIARQYNFWENYRRGDDAPVLKTEMVAKFFRRFEYVEPPRNPEPDRRMRDLGPGQPLDRTQVAVPAHVQFLNSAMPGLADDAAQAVFWHGTKFLGSGGLGMVGLWEYNNPAANAPVPTLGYRVAVKELSLGPINYLFTLGPEAGHYQALLPGRSPHIVTLLRNPGGIVAADEGLGPQWNGVVRRLFLEYCSLGSLQGLIERRIRLGVRLNELTLWRMFDCLIDGISALEYGFELQLDLVTRAFSPRPMPGLIPRVHFDLKPANILLNDQRITHPVPICKISDFGTTNEIAQPQDQSPAMDPIYESMRMLGTNRYYAPEQFTERWDYVGWQQSEIAGVYGAATNVWGIGCIMYQLLTMSLRPPDPKKPFLPAYTIRGSPARGVTYGVNLPAYPYSEELKHLIQECLYENPAHRPSLVDLKTAARDGMESAIKADATPEPWLDFLPAEPVPPLVANPPALPPGGPGATQAQKVARLAAMRAARQRANRDAARQPQPAERRTFIATCRHIYPETKKQCKNIFKTDGTKIYCNEHSF